VGFLEHIPASNPIVGYIGDPLPFVEQAVHSPRVRQLAAAPEVSRSFPTLAQDLEKAPAALQAMRGKIPLAIAFATDARLVELAVRIGRLGLFLDLCGAAATSSEPAVQVQLPILRRGILEDIEGIAVPPLVLWVQLPTAEVAAEVFTAASGMLEGVPYLAVAERTPTSLRLTFDLSSVLDRDALIGVAVESRVIDRAEDPVGGRLADRILGIHADITLEQRDAAVFVRVGSGGSEGPASPRSLSELGPLFDPNAAEMAAWATWDMGRAVELAAVAAKEVERWQDSATGRVLLGADTDDLAGDMLDLHRNLATTAPRGTARLDITDTVRLEVVEEPPPPAVSLNATGLVDIVPKDVLFAHLSATGGLGDAVSSRVQAMEDRMSTMWLKSKLKGDTSNAAEIQAMTKDYYAMFGPLRQLLLRRAPEIFAAPYSVVFALPEPEDASAVAAAGGGAGFVDFALIGKPRRMAVARRWLADLDRAVAAAAFAQRREPPPPIGELVPVDRQLGVPTQVPDLEWTADAFPGVPGVAPWVARLHVFEHRGFLVVSSSSRLSRRLLEGAEARFSVEDGVVAHGRLSGAATASLLSQLSPMFAGRTPSASDAVQLGVTVLGAVDDIEWTTRDVDGRRRTVATLRFAEAAGH
jgi:hypothetical protein